MRCLTAREPRRARTSYHYQTHKPWAAMLHIRIWNAGTNPWKETKAIGIHEPPRPANVGASVSPTAGFPSSGLTQNLEASSPLVSHVARKVIKQYSKQRQSRNTVRSKNPHTAAFAMSCRRLRTTYICRGITQGPIFHANLRGRKVVAREASHLPHTAAWQVLMAQMLLQNRFRGPENTRHFVKSV
jgi:hypothetical protein